MIMIIFIIVHTYGIELAFIIQCVLKFVTNQYDLQKTMCYRGLFTTLMMMWHICKGAVF
jgi:hypothetical protein